MNNFIFKNPVKIIFGKDMIKEIAKEIPANKRILIVYGGGSIKTNGVYDQVKSALASHYHEEFSGIEPNPHYETCMKAVEQIKTNKLDFILAVGGGSVVDAVKFIVAAACFEKGDPWAILSGASITNALPFGTVLTLPATGSEMNKGAVISKNATKEKYAFKSDLVYPQFSVLDPVTTYTLPPKQTGNGVVDAFVHVMEQYLTVDSNALIQDYFAEGIMKTLLIEGPKALKIPNNYDVRANLMWASTWALNGWIAAGVPEDWATHMIGHEITALYGLDHGQTLAIILPGIMKYLKQQKAEKISRLGKEVFALNETGDKLIDKTIDAVDGFFRSMNVPTHLSDYGLGKEVAESVGKRLSDRNWMLGEKQNISGEDVKKILIDRI